MSDVVIQSLVIIVPIGALFLGLYYFQSKQSNAQENRLREDMRDMEGRLRGEIVASEDRLRGEIKAVAESVETAKSELNHQLDRTDDKVSRLIQDVGVVQGAVLGISVQAGSREPEPTATS